MNEKQPWLGALRGRYTEKESKIREACVGKTIESALFASAGTDERLTLEFTDGTTLILQSYDQEGYSSGFYIHREHHDPA